MTSTPQEYFNKVQAMKRQGKSAATKYISFDAASPSLQQPDRCASYRHSITPVGSPIRYLCVNPYLNASRRMSR
jgi:hypothetical protein